MSATWRLTSTAAKSSALLCQANCATSDSAAATTSVSHGNVSSVSVTILLLSRGTSILGRSKQPPLSHDRGGSIYTTISTTFVIRLNLLRIHLQSKEHGCGLDKLGFFFCDLVTGFAFFIQTCHTSDDVTIADNRHHA